MKSKPLVAAITGDIIASRDLPIENQNTLARSIVSAGEELRKDHPDLISAKIDVFRGESWQFYCKSPENALKAGVLFKAYLLGKYGANTRLSIGLGEVDHINHAKISTSQGEAFIESGEGLDEMSKHRSLTIHVGKAFSPTRLWIQALATLLDSLTSQWTSKQALAVALTSTGQNNENAAQRWISSPISKQAFGKHLANANWDSICDSLELSQQELSTLLKQNESA